MAIIKCKMCGGDLEIQEGISVAECEYCGTQQTVPNVDNEKKLTLFNRANRLRAACEFDKAAGVYEAIVADFPEEAEAYWGLVLCKYGIEYVDDPATGKKIPTCHRSSFDSIMEDSDLEQALENADVVARKVYREEAKAMEELRKGIIEVSGKEEPYDMFICYKETDDKGERTIDSVLAQDLYDALTAKSYRVFFARITLEDKLGQEYEPYIFAALNSAKIMLVVGTDYEYFNAVWVKNEWSRYLKLMAADKSKHLIPCYKNVDAYDMPKEFAKLQAQDLGKVGATQDLLRGIEKLLPKQAAVQKETVVVQQSSGSSPNVQSLLKRAYIFMEDGDGDSADEYFDKVLDIDPDCAEAYLGKFLVYESCASLDAFVERRLEMCRPAKGDAHYFYIQEDQEHVAAFAEKYALGTLLTEAEIKKLYAWDHSYKSTVWGCEKQLEEEQRYWNSNSNLNRAFKLASGETAQTLQAARQKVIGAYEDALKVAREKELAGEQTLEAKYAVFLQETDAKVLRLHEEAVAKCQQIYAENAPILREAQSINELKSAINAVQCILDYEDVQGLVATAKARIDTLKEIARKDEIYESAVHSMQVGAEKKQIASYKSALAEFQTISGWKDADAKILACQEKIAELEALKETERLKAEQRAKVLAEKKKRTTIIAASIVCAVIAVGLVLYVLFTTIIPNSKYNSAKALLESGKYEEAVIAFEALDGYKDSDEKILESKYGAAAALLENKEYQAAHDAFAALGKYSDSAKMANESLYQYALGYWTEKKYEQSNPIFESLGSYSDSRDKIHTHDYASQVVLAPTCVAEGSTQYNCNTCSHTYTEPIVATGHAYSEKVTKKPTCEGLGEKTLTCKCGHVTTAPVPAAGHDYSKSKVTKAATCETDGERMVSCYCGAVFTEKIKATGHAYSSKITTAATCEKAGVKTFTCKCGKNYTESVSAKGHSYVEATCLKAKTCKTCNKAEGAALGHDWQPKNDVPECTRCDTDINSTINITVASGLPITVCHRETVSGIDHFDTFATITGISYQIKWSGTDEYKLELLLEGTATHATSSYHGTTSPITKEGDVKIKMELFDSAGNRMESNGICRIEHDENGNFQENTLWVGVLGTSHQTFHIPKNEISFQLVISEMFKENV